MFFFIKIIFFLRALDESSQAVSHPIEQIERIQRVADAWQTQVTIYIYIYFLIT